MEGSSHYHPVQGMTKKAKLRYPFVNETTSVAVMSVGAAAYLMGYGTAGKALIIAGVLGVMISNDLIL